MEDLAWSVIQVALLMPLGWLAWRVYEQSRTTATLRTVAVLVLGDVGRSPRMMYHAESFATMGFETYLVGYAGSTPVASLLSLPKVHFLYLSQPPSYLSSLPFVIAAPRKIIQQVLSVLHTLLIRIPYAPEFIIVQNPPSIPTLALVWLVSWLRGSKIIIDWHNLGYSILALKLGERHILVKIAKWLEAYFGRVAYAHLFVTRAMRDFLLDQWNLQGHTAVLHDRPPAHFHKLSPSETHELFLRLRTSLTASDLATFLPPSSPPESTPFTTTTNVHTSAISSISTTVGTPESDLSDLFDTDFALGRASAFPALRADRPALLVSSTSWTPDEDFSILLGALKLYEIRARALEFTGGGTLPKVLMVVTGKGPLRDTYMRDIERLQSGAADEPEVEGGGGWRYVRCVSMWLEAEEYPHLLGSADLGISLHASSSALDLPMKVVDMFGCGLPVCALGFACLDELVQDGINGLVFHSAEQLAEQLETLLIAFPSSRALETLRKSLEHSEDSSVTSETVYLSDTERHWGTWTQNWNRVVKPLVLSGVSSTMM